MADFDVFGPVDVAGFDSAQSGNDNTYAALALALCGGFFMGLYPLFIKTDAVLAAKPHPVVFQMYKSSCVFISGFIFLIPRYLRKEADEPLFVFTKWGVISAAAWIPSGLCTIFAVPLIGMGMQVSIASAASSVLSFLVFWLVFDSKMKNSTLAPIYLALVVLGMVGMVFTEKLVAKFIRCSGPVDDGRDAEKKGLLVNAVDDDADSAAAAPKQRTSPIMFMVGVLASILGGVAAATQYGVVTQGKTTAEKHYQCTTKNKNGTTTTPAPNSQCADLTEAFDHFGSWFVSFGIGAIAVTLFLLLIVTIKEGSVPNMHFKTLRTAGVAAGSCWVIGNFCTTVAVQLGGNAVVMAQGQSAQIIFSGLFGMFWYKEMKATDTRLVWALLAGFTLTFMILLGLEKAK